MNLPTSRTNTEGDRPSYLQEYASPEAAVQRLASSVLPGTREENEISNSNFYSILVAIDRGEPARITNLQAQINLLASFDLQSAFNSRVSPNPRGASTNLQAAYNQQQTTANLDETTTDPEAATDGGSRINQEVNCETGEILQRRFEETMEDLDHNPTETFEIRDLDQFDAGYWPSIEKLDGLRVRTNTAYPIPKPKDWKEDKSVVSIRIDKSRSELWFQCKREIVQFSSNIQTSHHIQWFHVPAWITKNRNLFGRSHRIFDFGVLELNQVQNQRWVAKLKVAIIWARVSIVA